MKKLFLLVSITMFTSFFISCDQDEYFNDRWNSKEVYSLATKTRSIDVENNPVKMMYILSGNVKETYQIILNYAEINFEMSWPEGFTVDENMLTVTYENKLLPPYNIIDFNITHRSLTNYKAAFGFNGKLINTQRHDTISFMGEITAKVETKEKEVINPNK